MNAERDAHLAQALKHAPDAGLSAPQQLGEQIVAAARQAQAEDQAATRSKPRWRTRWLSPPPGGSWGRTGAFATVLMAGLLTWMWPARTPAPAPAGDTIAQAPAFESTPVAAPTAQRTGPATAATPAQAPMDDERRNRVMRAARPPPTSPPAAVAQALGAAPQATVVAQAAPAAPPPVVTGQATPAPAPTDVTQAAPAAPPPVVFAEATNRAHAQAMPAFGSRSMLSAPAPSVHASLAAWLQRQPPDLSWRIDGSLPTAVSLPWLQRLAASTGNRWQTIGTASAGPAATSLLLLTGAGPVAQLTLHKDHVLWCDATAAACSRAVLTPDVMTTLEKELPR